MLEGLATRVLFWSALAILAAAAGLLSGGADVAWAAFGSALAGWGFLRGTQSRSKTREHRASQRQLEMAMHANAEGVFLLRAIRDASGAISDFEIRDVNPSGARLLRAAPGELTGRRLCRDLPRALPAAVFARYVDAMTTHVPLMEDVRVNTRLFAAGWMYHQAVPTGDGVAVTLRDIADRKREESRLRRASLTDDLTQLYNRRGFLSLADQQLRIARRQDRDAVLMYIDLDDFKDVNDQCGHAEGDRVLIAVGRLLRRSVRDCDVVGRLGGDEFTIIALDADRAAARLIQRRIEDRIALLNASGEFTLPLSLTIGHTHVRPTDQASVTELLARADALLYARKRRRQLTEHAHASARGRTRSASDRPLAKSPPLVVPPDVAAIARATVLASAARAPAANPSPYFPSRVAG